MMETLMGAISAKLGTAYQGGPGFFMFIGSVDSGKAFSYSPYLLERTGDSMKKGIHPEYYQAKVTCGGCGTEFEVGCTVPQIHVNVCSACHPFYTGTQKLLDSEGRVERFRAKYSKFQKK